MNTRTRRGSVVNPLGLALALSILGTFGTSLRAQSIQIESPNNESSTTPGVKLDVLGRYSFAGTAADNILVRMWEVDVDDNSVGLPADDKSIENLVAGSSRSWAVELIMPDQPPRTTRRYKITAQIRSGTTVKSTTTIFVNSAASGGAP